MKKFFTSYYALSGSEEAGVRVSASAPKFYNGMSFPQLYPPWSIIKAVKNGDIDKAEYKRLYLQHISHIDPQFVYDELPDGAILLCYEKDSTYCHRRIIAEWLENELGITIDEISNCSENNVEKYFEF
jgi:hypothetical protein